LFAFSSALRQQLRFLCFRITHRFEAPETKRWNGFAQNCLHTANLPDDVRQNTKQTKRRMTAAPLSFAYKIRTSATLPPAVCSGTQ
jgi:hypothetical protein